MPDEQIECARHGLTNHFLDRGKYYRCRKCCYEYVVNARRNVKKKLVESLGGKCVKCGYDRCQEAMDFHHLDSDEKDFGISQNMNKAISKLIEEIKKCILLCNRCHREYHSGLWEIDNSMIPDINLDKVCRKNKVEPDHQKLPRKTKIEWPDIKDLVEMVENDGFRLVAEKLGVSGNSVRKRIKTRSLS